MNIKIQVQYMTLVNKVSFRPWRPTLRHVRSLAYRPPWQLYAVTNIINNNILFYVNIKYKSLALLCNEHSEYKH